MLLKTLLFKVRIVLSLLLGCVYDDGNDGADDDYESDDVSSWLVNCFCKSTYAQSNCDIKKCINFSPF